MAARTAVAGGSTPAPTAVRPASFRCPLDQAAWQARLPRGQVHLIPDRCKGCRLCVEFCPQQVLMLSPAMNTRGYHYPVVAPGKENACVACGFCSLICPEFAIFAVELNPAARHPAPAGEEPA